MISFDLICPKEVDLSPFLLAAEKKKIASLGILTIGEEPFSGELSILSDNRKESVLCFFHFPYENRVWDLSKTDEFSALLLRLQTTGVEFLTLYRSVCKEAIAKTDCRFAFGLEAFGRCADELFGSAACRKSLLDLTDCMAKRGMTIGYATKHSVYDLSPCVLRRLAELRADLLPASFAERPHDVGKGVEKSILAARAAGIGSYITFSNSGWERRPIATYKENP